MSRIYDALYKAKHRVSRDSIESGTPPERISPASAVPTAGPRLDTSCTQPPQPGGDSVKASGLLTAFVERCPRTDWAPDPSAILFYAEEFRTPGSEEFRTLRSHLDLIRQTQSLQTLLVTSPMPGEGKSFVAANLAQVMVWQRERHVLLIDGDLRASKLHDSLGVPAAPGLSDYLRGDVNEFAVVRRGPLENLFFIPGGSNLPNASELIANGQFRALLKRLSAAFDWIIIDSPPVVPVADARLMAEFCDGVLLVLKAGETPGDLAQVAYGNFRGKRFVGVVLNRADPQSTYGYDYYYPKKHRRRKRTGTATIID